MAKGYTRCKIGAEKWGYSAVGLAVHETLGIGASQTVQHRDTSGKIPWSVKNRDVKRHDKL